MPDRRVLGLTRPGRDRPHHHFAGVDADANLDRRAALGAQLVGVAPQLLLHPQRGVKRALRMVLVRDRRAEQREDPVAGGLHDVAVVAMHRVDHQLQRRIDDRARFFGVEVLLQLGRALDVGEQRRDRLALAVRCAPSACWGVMRMSGVVDRCLERFSATELRNDDKRSAAVTTEPLGRFVMSATGRAAQLQRLATLGTEFSPFTIIGPALSATHRLIRKPERVALLLSPGARKRQRTAERRTGPCFDSVCTGSERRGLCRGFGGVGNVVRRVVDTFRTRGGGTTASSSDRPPRNASSAIDTRTGSRRIAQRPRLPNVHDLRAIHA